MENASETAVLSCCGLVQHLGPDLNRITVLHGLSLSLQPARVYAVMGPSGCGKSTLLYLAGLLDRPDAGEIVLKGRSMARASDEVRTRARNEHIGFVFQFHFLLPEFTAMENVILPMRKQNRLSPPQMEERAKSLLREVGLEDKVDRLSNQLSGGEQQRVAIARALANAPALVLADEPTGNLDSANSHLVFNLMYQFAKEKKHAVLIATHNREIAQKCETVFQMQDGRFVEPES